MAGKVEGRVECHSGHEYAERPLAFYWMNKRSEVERILQEQITPEGKRFLVETPENETFWLEYNQRDDRWVIVPG